MMSLWACWPSLRRRLAEADRLALLLDYDGTLVPIAARPALARLPSPTRRRLAQLRGQPGVQVAVVSGRALRDVRRRVGLRGVWYVGNHGLELDGPGCRYRHPAAQAARPALRQAARRLRAALRAVTGAWVEDKGLTLSVHTRAVAEDDIGRAARVCSTVLQPYRAGRRLRVTKGARVINVHPPVRWTKGTMVRWWLARQPVGRRPMVWYVGDDRTDEDAFAALRARGVTIVVTPSPRNSRARYAVASPADVSRLLQRIASVWQATHGGRHDATGRV